MPLWPYRKQHALTCSLSLSHAWNDNVWTYMFNSRSRQILSMHAHLFNPWTMTLMFAWSWSVALLRRSMDEYVFNRVVRKNLTFECTFTNAVISIHRASSNSLMHRSFFISRHSHVFPALSLTNKRHTMADTQEVWLYYPQLTSVCYWCRFSSQR